MNQTTAAGSSGNRMQNESRPWIPAILVACVICGCTLSSLAGDAQTLRVRDRAVAQQLIAGGGQLIADYGGFQIIATDNSASALQHYPGRVEPMVSSDAIDLNAGPINTRSVQARASRKMKTGFAGRQLHLVQFIGPVKPEWRADLEAQGVKIVNYVPANAYLIQGDAAALARLQDWAAGAKFVQWDGEYSDDLKIHPDARKREAWGTTPPDLEADFAVQLFPDNENTAATLELIDSLKLAPVERDFQVLHFRNIVVRLPVDRIAELSSRPDVVSIQRYTVPDKRDERQAQILAGNLLGSGPNGPGYLDWLAERGFTQAQFDVSAFLVDIADSGIDNGTIAPGHFALYRNGETVQGSRVVYNRLLGTAHPGSLLSGCDGHGNLNAHILAGFANSLGGFPHVDGAGYQYGLGVCPFVRIGSSVVFDPDLFTAPNYADLESRAYQDGARISANSWGATNNAYTVDAQAFDALVRDAQPEGSAFPTPGNQEMVIVFAAGNRGNAANTVGAPGTAKNVITVGAAENVRSLSAANGGRSTMGSDGCGYTDANADSANDLATFSSRGPCSDGRQKPDLVAPGTHIVGGVPQQGLAPLGIALEGFRASSICALSGGGAVGSTNNFFPLGQQFYTVSSGTSHATPAIAGACALLRQFFINHNWAVPSPAMTKAWLMNSARYLTGAGANDNLWSPGQGMGAANLGRALDDVPRVLRDQRAADIFTASGQTRVFTGRIVNTNEPMRVTVAWTDAPGSTVGNAFNNDLDLTVQVGTQLYLGNVFSGSRSIPGGVADARNNVESVFLPAGTEGDVTITITAANINSDGVPNWGGNLDQDFALVAYNVTNTMVPILKPTGAEIIEEGFTPANQAIDAGEMITLSLSLRNTGTRTATNLQVTLLATNGVTQPGGAVSYGNLAVGDVPLGRNFTFVAAGVCGGLITPTFLLSDASGFLGTIDLELPLGRRVVEVHDFTNASSLLIPDSGAASLYPSTIVVSGLTGIVTHATATLRGFSHSWPDDVDVVLTGPGGQKVMLLSDCGGGNACAGLTLTFDDTGSVAVPDSGSIISGVYKPSNVDTTTDNFPAPAPTGPFARTLDVFNGSNANGNWSLYIQDDGAMDSGSLTQGWVLSLTTSNLLCAAGDNCVADLGLGVELATNLVSVGSVFDFKLIVTNQGPNPATFVSLTNVFPFGFVLQTATPARGSWSQSGNVGYWSLGQMETGAVTSILFRGKCLLGGNVTNVAVVGSFTPDLSAGDNAAQVGFFVVNSGGNGLGINTNSPPVLQPLANRTVHAGTRVHFVATATDTDSPTNELTFALLAGAAAGATVDAYSGDFFWQTTDMNEDSTNNFTMRVSDASSPPLTDSKSFSIIVKSRPLITDLSIHDGLVWVRWDAIPGQGYQLQTTTNLQTGNWEAGAPIVVAADASVTHTNLLGPQSRQFYRVLVLP